MKLGSLLLRTTVGPLFIGHGTQKLFGVNGGHGLKGTAEAFEGMGLKPGIVHASLAGVAETAGGAGLLLGYRTPFASSAIIATMITAIERVHGKNGWDTTKGGYEYNVVLIAAALAVVDNGPGKISIDGLRGKEVSGARWTLASLALAAGAAAAAHQAAGFFGGAKEGPTVEPAPVSAPPEGAEPIEQLPIADAAALTDHAGPADGPVEPVTPTDGP